MLNKKFLFHYKKTLFHSNLKNTKVIKENVSHRCRSISSENAKFLGKVTRNKRVKEKKSQPRNKYTFIEVSPFMFKALKHVHCVKSV